MLLALWLCLEKRVYSDSVTRKKEGVPTSAKSFTISTGLTGFWPPRTAVLLELEIILICVEQLVNH